MMRRACPRSRQTPRAGACAPAPASSPPPVPSFAPPGFVVNLQPSSDCVHPDVTADCSGDFCRVPAGCFILGAPRDEYAAARYDDVQVPVTLTRPFEIGRYEVTNEQWLEAGFELPARDFDVGTCRDAQCPISNINFFEAVAFANHYSELQGLGPCFELRECTGTFGSGSVCNRAGNSTPWAAT